MPACPASQPASQMPMYLPTDARRWAALSMPLPPRPTIPLASCRLEAAYEGAVAQLGGIYQARPRDIQEKMQGKFPDITAMVSRLALHSAGWTQPSQADEPPCSASAAHCQRKACWHLCRCCPIRLLGAVDPSAEQPLLCSNSLVAHAVLRPHDAPALPHPVATDACTHPALPPCSSLPIAVHQVSPLCPAAARAAAAAARRRERGRGGRR